ncbi:MAG: SDR family NAD(P)-dependent oxidoreductase [Candidatus Heimdallarchaeota archaeon]|nr:SDR family NAD(P)-dependent oxidoreductase [Candidatus Heimdallarchaeota archaeon]
MSKQQGTKTISVTNNQAKIALITGANSGIGLETSARLAEEGFGKIILAVRTVEKGEAAKAKLIERTGKDVFDILTIDVSEFEIVHAAADELVKRQDKIDLLILNAGMSPSNTDSYNSSGVEITFATHIIGHHILTMRLLSDQLLAHDARIIIASSEGSRGDLPGMAPPDFEKLAEEHFDNDLVAALQALTRNEEPHESKVMNIYVTAKTFSNWWAAVLSRKLPKGMTVNAVSPGSVPATNYARNQGFMMRRVMTPMMKVMGRFMGMAWKLEDGANRYYEVSQFDDTITGHFFASKKRLTGEMVIQENDHFVNQEFQEAGWNAIVAVSGGIDYPIAIPA